MTEGVTASPQGAYASDRFTATATLFTPASPLPTNLLLRKIFAGTLYKREVPRAPGSGRAAEGVIPFPLSRPNIPRNVIDDRFFKELSERHDRTQQRHAEREQSEDQHIPARKIEH